MLIYNTYTREKEEFKPIEENKVKMYICGPTVYNYIHIGNARPVLFFDLVHRYFKYLGYDVEFVSNVTDVDDKIINRAIEENITEAQVAEKYLNYFLECNQLLSPSQGGSLRLQPADPPFQTQSGPALTLRDSTKRQKAPGSDQSQLAVEDGVE